MGGVGRYFCTCVWALEWVCLRQRANLRADIELPRKERYLARRPVRCVSVCVCVCVHVCLCACVCVYMCVCVYVYMYVYMYICIYIHIICMNVCMYVSMYVCICGPAGVCNMSYSRRVCMYICMCLCMHAGVYVQVSMHMCTHSE